MSGYILTTEIEQHVGDHSTGMREMRRKTVVTDLSNHADKDYDDLTADEKEWWDSALADIHAASVAIAELNADERRAVEGALLAESLDDLEYTAIVMQRVAGEVLGRPLIVAQN